MIKEEQASSQAQTKGKERPNTSRSSLYITAQISKSPGPLSRRKISLVASPSPQIHSLLSTWSSEYDHGSLAMSLGIDTRTCLRQQPWLSLQQDEFNIFHDSSLLSLYIPSTVREVDGAAWIHSGSDMHTSRSEIQQKSHLSFSYKKNDALRDGIDVKLSKIFEFYLPPPRDSATLFLVDVQLRHIDSYNRRKDHGCYASNLSISFQYRHGSLILTGYEPGGFTSQFCSLKLANLVISYQFSFRLDCRYYDLSIAIKTPIGPYFGVLKQTSTWLIFRGARRIESLEVEELINYGRKLTLFTKPACSDERRETAISFGVCSAASMRNLAANSKLLDGLTSDNRKYHEVLWKWRIMWKRKALRNDAHKRAKEEIKEAPVDSLFYSHEHLLPF
ncbi:uncharacterized protein BDR25DRAFT_361395 [Lindgomyces ingoldianus]|uniref:Uncharacterized protein n=1 Tax=Lindgomyces ingoldianus TaxID=673940 RepID=A0ACB6QCB2_9PLEO|nr:uncharacterized protein BDR25DRAFT_361395 [Lindgomyces ingoldianus]KAF2464551.1 hypothetical protein BDR25DRAFT_361395 [Lindgomyces ingoldianus]